MITKKTIAAASLAAFLAVPALAAGASINTAKNLSDGASVSLSGTVEDFSNAKSFTLHDSTGTISVDTSSAPSVVLKNGDTVNVSGRLNKGVLGASVAATSVSEDKTLGQQVGSAINSITGDDEPSNAQAVNIKGLPDKGMVKVEGTVDSVSSEKKFTLRDSTGTVDVALKSEQSASLQKGASVTVFGYVNNGMLSKSIDATKIELRH